MKYMGSKTRHANDIVEIIHKISNGVDFIYIEPFVGGANVIDKVRSTKKFGYDSNKFLITMLSAASQGWMPPKEISFEEYKEIKARMDCEDPMTGYAGFALSYGGKFFGGWRRDSKGDRNYCLEAWRNAEKQFKLLNGIVFSKSDYKDIQIPEKCIVYCDPPYKGTTVYCGNFCHDEYRNWVRGLVSKKDGVIILCSEYEMPDDFIAIWSKKVNSSLTKNTGGKNNIEKIFIHKKQLYQYLEAIK